MAASGYTPVIIYNSGTTTNVPLAANLASGELAINYADGKLFYKDNSSAIQVIGWKTTPVSAGGTGSTTLTANNVLLGNGTSALQVVAPGTSGNVLTSNGTTWTSATPAAGVSLSVANTWTATQTFNGTSSTFATVLLNAAETTTVSATAATGTINYYINSQSVLYYTTNASANWTLNVAFSSGTSLNTAMSTGQTVTIAFLVTQGSTAYYASAMNIDGTAVTPKWQGGTAPTKGNASGIDVYTYTITKTASATYTVLASLTQFA